MQIDVLDIFKEKAKNSGVLGCFSKTIDSSFVETAGYAGFDFMILDMEHGFASLETIQSHIRAADSAGIIPIVRVPDWKGAEISRVLDIGAKGIQVPNVSSAEQIKTVIDAAKFHPIGKRGVCRFVKAANFGEEKKEDYFFTANKTLIIIQIEGVEVIDKLDEILAVDGYDILFIGPYDLSQSLGIPGQIEHEKVLKLMTSIIQKVHAKSKMIGVFVDTVEQLNTWKKLKLNYYAYSVDTALFAQALRWTKQHFDRK